MLDIKKVKRKSAVLTPSTLACLSNIATINLTAGCAHGCLYCYTRGYSIYPGAGKVAVYINTLEKLCDEISRRRTKPLAVYFSPSSDIFQPVPEVLDQAYDILSFLFEREIKVAFLTKGLIPERHLRLICSHAHLVRGQIGLITTNERLLRIFEPRAAAARARLNQAKRFVASGIETRVRGDPILPGITDDEKSLNNLCKAIAGAGVRRIAASALFIRTAVRQSLRTGIGENNITNNLMHNFRDAHKLRIHAENSTVTAMPSLKRIYIYNRLAKIAVGHSLEVRLCACKNPDLAAGSCSIAGDWCGPAQRNLF